MTTIANPLPSIRERWHCSYGFKATAILAICVGILIHSTTLLIGRERFQEFIYTPLFDLFFTLLMSYAAVAGWISWRRVLHPYRVHRVLYGLIVSYFTLSVIVHIRGLIAWDTSYIDAFPAYYSLYLLPILLAILTFLWRLRFQEVAR